MQTLSQGCKTNSTFQKSVNTIHHFNILIRRKYMIVLMYEKKRQISNFIHYNNLSRAFPGGAVVKSPPANAGDTGLSPGSGRSHMLQSD